MVYFYDEISCVSGYHPEGDEGREYLIYFYFYFVCYVVCFYLFS